MQKFSIKEWFVSRGLPILKDKLVLATTVNFDVGLLVIVPQLHHFKVRVAVASQRILQLRHKHFRQTSEVLKRTHFIFTVLGGRYTCQDLQSPDRIEDHLMRISATNHYDYKFFLTTIVFPFNENYSQTHRVKLFLNECNHFSINMTINL